MKKKIIIAVLLVAVLASLAVISVSAKQCGHTNWVISYEPGSGRQVWTCYDCGYVCQHVSYSYTCADVDGVHKTVYKCTTCDYIAASYTASTRVTYVSDGSNGHYINTVCYYCDEVFSEMYSPHTCNCPCGYSVPHKWSDGYCERCAIQCKHSSSYIVSNKVSDDQHRLDCYCSDCHLLVDSMYDEHSYNNCVCACGHVKHTTVESFENGSEEGHDLVSKCVTCGYVALRFHVVHNDVGIDYVEYSDTGNDSYHELIATCKDCGYNFRSATLPHAFNSYGHCTQCSHACSHSVYEDGACKYCKLTCPHEFDFTSDSGLDKLLCTICNEELTSFSSLSSQVNFFKRPSFKDAWNNRLSDLNFDYDLSGNIRGVFQRFTNDNFSYNANATITLVGSFQYPTYVGSFKPARYAVFKLRYNDVNYLELDLYASKDYDGVSSVPSTECSAFNPIYLKALAEDQWHYVVIDLTQFSPKNSTAYDLTSLDDFHYMRALLCATFTSSSGYLDIDFFGLCNDLREADICFSKSYYLSNNSDCYYSYDKSADTFVWKRSSHNFKGADGKYSGKCSYCGYSCAHPDVETRTSVKDKQRCAIYQFCPYCRKDYNWKYPDHTFNDHSVECSVCGHDCYHSYKNGVCKDCHLQCDHVYVDGHINCYYCNMFAPTLPENYENGFFDLISSIYDAQVHMFQSFTNYSIWGVNIASLIFTIVTLAVALVFVKFLIKLLT